MAGTTGGGADLGARRAGRTERLSTETKHSFKTSEFVAFVVTYILILVAGLTIEGDEGGKNPEPDYFTADKVWLYITILTLGYMLSRGLAKSGSRDPYWGGGTNEQRDRDLGRGGDDR